MFSGDTTNMGIFLKWLTGCKTIPPLGFPKGFTVKFVHGCDNNCKCRPTVSTCFFYINLPVHINNGDEMIEIMYSALNDSKGFGLV